MSRVAIVRRRRRRCQRPGAACPRARLRRQLCAEHDDEDGDRRRQHPRRLGQDAAVGGVLHHRAPAGVRIGETRGRDTRSSLRPRAAPARAARFRPPETPGRRQQMAREPPGPGAGGARGLRVIARTFGPDDRPHTAGGVRPAPRRQTTARSARRSARSRDVRHQAAQDQHEIRARQAPAENPPPASSHRPSAARTRRPDRRCRRPAAARRARRRS